MEVWQVEFKTVVRLTDLDVAGDVEVRHTQRRLCQLAYDGARHMVLDISAVTYLNSEALSMFILVYKLLLTDEGVLILRRPTPHVLELLRITRLCQILDIEVGED